MQLFFKSLAFIFLFNVIFLDNRLFFLLYEIALFHKLELAKVSVKIFMNLNYF